jgi:hypothetical protein
MAAAEAATAAAHVAAAAEAPAAAHVAAATATTPSALDERQAIRGR